MNTTDLDELLGGRVWHPERCPGVQKKRVGRVEGKGLWRWPEPTPQTPTEDDEERIQQSTTSRTLSPRPTSGFTGVMSPDQTRPSPEPFNFQTYSSPDEPGPSSYQSPDAAQLGQDDFNVSFLLFLFFWPEQYSVFSTSLWTLTRITHALVGTAPWFQPARVPAACSPLRRLPATDPPVCDPQPRRYVVSPTSRPHLDHPFRKHFKTDSTFLGWGLWDEVSQL